ncbi:LPXTG cell wall anchor domain-containing protein (plasmid) [Embleya sp. NBC_00888]|uniref:LPXTG cell wall anchor domain-containing protein n=1 Tax=Embleya sp. NBC_00888 TaxID=2975960 RepID=UPI002F918307|nr:LPXTG cell wall anchor domain-containing protein [Embleya sp. NBC_00888]
MRMPEINSFARRFAVGTPIAVLVALALPAAAGTAHAADATTPPSSSATPTPGAGRTTPPGKAPSPTATTTPTKAPTSTKPAPPKDDPRVGEPGYKPWLALTADVPSTVTRGKTFQSRLTVTNTSEYNDIASPQIAILLTLTGGNTSAEPRDVTVGYRLPGKATQTLAVTRSEQSLLVNFDIPGTLRAGKSVTVELSVTIKASTTTGVTDGSLQPWMVKVPGQDVSTHRFKVVGPAVPDTAKPTPETAEKAPATGSKLTELPKTGSATAMPLTLAGGALVLLGGGAVATARRRNTR